MATTIKPSNSVSIKIQRVKTAVLAKMEIVSTEKTGETHAYTFKGNNNTKGKKKKEKIASIILEKGGFNDTDKQTTIKQIVSVLTKDSYKKGDCIDVPLVKPKVKFNKLPSASLGDEVYVVIETENMPDREIKMNFKQGGDTKVVTDVNEPIYVLQEDSKQANFLFTAKVGEFAKKDTVSNAKDFEHHAICKIKLASSNDDTNKKYKDALNKAEDKKSFFYILMDAEPEDNGWFSVKYEEFFDNRPNVWYYGEGNWFELEKGGLLFPFKTIPLNHPDGFKNKSYKPYDYTLHEKKAPTFGYKRGGNRIHAARDLYYELNEPIYAMDDGVVKDVYEFYYDTWAIEIEHDYEYKKGNKLYVRYGEVSKNNINVKKGDKVKQGDKIAEIGLLVPNVKQPGSDKRGMLHIEMYTGEESGKLTNKTVKYSDMMYATSTNYSKDRSFQRRKDLIDPLPLLEDAYENSKSKKILK